MIFQQKKKQKKKQIQFQKRFIDHALFKGRNILGHGGQFITEGNNKCENVFIEAAVL